MQWKALALALLVEHGSAQQFSMMRFGCSQLTIDRIDPLVNGGQIPGPHMHQIVGGNSFNATMDPATHDLPTASSCTSCTFSEDFSNYWTAVLYFRARNGTFMRVPQFPSQGISASGGILVYYIPPYDGHSKVTAFKPGFRMLVGRRVAELGRRQLREEGVPPLHAGDGGREQRGVRGARHRGAAQGAVRRRHSDRHHVSPLAGTGRTRIPRTTGPIWPIRPRGPSTTAVPAQQRIPLKVPQVMYEVMWKVSGRFSFWPVGRVRRPSWWTAAGRSCVGLTQLRRGMNEC